MIGVVIKIVPKLTRDRVRKLINKQLVDFIVQCLALIAETPVNELIIRSSVLAGETLSNRESAVEDTDGLLGPP